MQAGRAGQVRSGHLHVLVHFAQSLIGHSVYIHDAHITGGGLEADHLLLEVHDGALQLLDLLFVAVTLLQCHQGTYEKRAGD